MDESVIKRARVSYRRLLCRVRMNKVVERYFVGGVECRICGYVWTSFNELDESAVCPDSELLEVEIPEEIECPECGQMSGEWKDEPCQAIYSRRQIEEVLSEVLKSTGKKILKGA